MKILNFGVMLGCVILDVVCADPSDVLLLLWCSLGEVACWQIPPMCKNLRLIENGEPPYKNYIADDAKEKELDEKHKNIQSHIKAAIECGKKCLVAGASGKCYDVGIIAKRGKRTFATKRSCDVTEMTCAVLYEHMVDPGKPKYAKSAIYSLPKCKQRKVAVTWIKYKNEYCKIIQSEMDREKSSLITTVDCEHEYCCKGAFVHWPPSKCKPGGWVRKTFCVYCPRDRSGDSGHPDPHGETRLVVRYYPQACTCNTQWCSYTVAAH